MAPWYLILPGVFALMFVAWLVRVAIQSDRDDPAIREAFAREHEQLKVTR